MRDAPCTAAQLGVSTCPCSGAASEAEYRAIVDRLVHALVHDPAALLEPLADKMAALALAERYEEAADVRDRAAALAKALARQRRLDALRRSGTVQVELPGVGGLVLSDGRYVRSWAEAPDPGAQATLALPFPAPEPSAATGTAGAPLSPGPGLALGEPLPRERADELLCVARWLDTKAARLRLVHAERGLVSSLPPLPSYEPVRGERSATRSASRPRQPRRVVS